MLRIPTVDNGTRGGISILEDDPPLGICLIHTAQMESQERVDEVTGREDLEVRQRALGDVGAVRRRIREKTSGGDVDYAS